MIVIIQSLKKRDPCLALVVQPFGESNDYARLPGAQVPKKHLRIHDMHHGSCEHM
jgi:hypothetical protein